MYSPKAIANAFLDLAEESKMPLTQMKLHKLIYYAHGWHLGLLGKPMIDETIEAWKFGPVIRSLYYEFRDVGSNPIERRATEWDSSGDEFCFVTPSVAKGDTPVIALLDRIWKVYGALSAVQLSKMTHESGSPWTQTWDKAKADGVIKGVDIPNDLIREYFEKKAEANRHAAGSI
jgi:uncharacterized phage-associated protein